MYLCKNKSNEYIWICIYKSIKCSSWQDLQPLSHLVFCAKMIQNTRALSASAAGRGFGLPVTHCKVLVRRGRSGGRALQQWRVTTDKTQLQKVALTVPFATWIDQRGVPCNFSCFFTLQICLAGLQERTDRVNLSVNGNTVLAARASTEDGTLRAPRALYWEFRQV